MTSFRIVRSAFYEFFIICHIAFGLMFIVGCYFHWPKLNFWIWPCLFLWGLDRFVGLARMLIINKWWTVLSKRKTNPDQTATVEQLCHDVVRLTFHRPMLKWTGGQHCYIVMPGVAQLPYEQHPFTIANMPDGTGDAVLIIRAHSGFTRRLANQTETTLRAHFEGPYGAIESLNHFDTVVLVAGGTGITYALSHLLSILQSARAGQTAVSRAHLVWNVRHHSDVSWIAPLLNAAFEKGLGGTEVHIDVYVTRSAAAAEPIDSQHHVMSEKDTSPNAPDGTGDETAVNSGAVSPESGLSSSHSRDSYDPELGLGAGPKDKEKSAMMHKDTGISMAVSDTMTFHRGRSHLQMILGHDVAASARVGAGLALAVCGPTALAIDGRRAVCQVNTAKKVWEGQTPVHFLSGNFGF